MNLRRIVEIAWLLVAAVSSVEFYISYRDTGFSTRTIVLLVAIVVALFMYSLRKRMRRKMEEYNQSNKDL